MENNTILNLTRDEALKYVRNAKTKRVYVRGATDLPTTEGRAFLDISCHIRVSRKLAATYITNLLSDSFHNRGAKIRINTAHLPNCLFIG